MLKDNKTTKIDGLVVVIVCCQYGDGLQYKRRWFGHYTSPENIIGEQFPRERTIIE
jgi:hypothetical protein